MIGKIRMHLILILAKPRKKHLDASNQTLQASICKDIVEIVFDFYNLVTNVFVND